MTVLKLAALAAAIAAVGGCTPAPQANRAEVKDKLYVVTPATLKVKAGLLTGEMTDMKITERVEEGSGRIDMPARLTAKLVLKNVSPDQTLRLLAGNVIYIDMQGKAIPMENNRGEPTLKLSSYGQERLDPGQETTESLDVEFPAAALQAKTLGQIRLELAYVPSPYREETLNFAVTISESK